MDDIGPAAVRVYDYLKYVAFFGSIPVSIWLVSALAWPWWLVIPLIVLPVPVALYLVLSTAYTVIAIPVLLLARRRQPW